MKNKRDRLFLFGILLVLTGVVFNYIAIIENGCKMPVKTNWMGYETKRHFGYMYFEEVNYPILTDIFNISILIVSIGDILMVSGLLIIVLDLIKVLVNWRKIIKEKENVRKIY